MKDFELNCQFLFIFIHFRWKPISFNFPTGYWSLALGLGNINENDGSFEDSILLGVWESGPWIGFNRQETTVMGWIGAGTAVYELMVK